jgi:hypothetical protein
MKRVAKKTERLEDRIAKRIARRRGDVFLRTDFREMGNYNQVGRALRSLVREGRLVKIGQGLYARARKSALDGKPVPENGLQTLTEALRRLGVKVEPSRAMRAYNSGRSEQVPTGRVVAIRDKRVRRQIGYDGIFLMFERWEPDDQPERHSKKNKRTAVPGVPITVREALRLIWEADHYPILGNEDWRVSAALAKDALEKAATAIPCPTDPPEFMGWLTTLLDQSAPAEDREAAMSALYDLFDPEDAHSS